MKKQSIKDYISGFMPEIEAEAHCDIPCGMYDPTAAKVAAKTVQRMVMQIEELKMPENMADTHATAAHANMLVRRIAVKEQHAQMCKQELLILWTDFFKPEHLEKYPNLHEMFWKAAKLCSKNKQDIDRAPADALVAAVDEIAAIFYEAKNDPARFEAYKQITDKLF